VTSVKKISTSVKLNNFNLKLRELCSFKPSIFIIKKTEIWTKILSKYWTTIIISLWWWWLGYMKWQGRSQMVYVGSIYTR